MSMLERVYSLGVRSLQATFPLLGRGKGKLARGIRGRDGVLDRMRDWAERERRIEQPLVWLHAPSVGEGLQATAVLEELLRRRPELQVVYTFFSPSAEALASRVRADFADYLPLDTPAAVGAALDLLRPDLIAFSKTDVWPILTREARRRGVSLVMISGTLPPSSSRLRGPARRLLQPAYARLDRVAAISDDDSRRFGELGVPAARRTVMGDAHFDRVLARVAAIDGDSPLLRPLRRPEPVLVAGSTWSADEGRLVPALATLRREGVEFAAILVPHEPSEAHLVETELRLRSAGLPHRRLGALHGAWDGSEVLIVDRVGILGDLYGVAAIALVGGGFGKAGLHSVLEPAAHAIPVLFGPNHQNAREAGDLVRVGGAFTVRDGGEMLERLRALLAEPEVGRSAGAAARALVERGEGAATRGATLILDLLDARQTG